MALRCKDTDVFVWHGFRTPRWPLLAMLLFSAVLSAQELWTAVGPTGGDARAFAAVPGQPAHLYLGSTSSWIYESLDGGATWRRLAKLDDVDDLIVDHIVVDAAHPRTVYAAGWRLDKPDGGLWVSQDGGKIWSEVPGLRGQSIRAFAQAPSNPNVLFAGSLDGVFRSNDAGETWRQISPKGSHEIHEVESLAVDPADSQIVYAGTWHLPWKTTDGGKSWRNIKNGVIDDSDVFSIIIDPMKPKIVYASACSGIYKSESGGEKFQKVQGIPSTARRTRVLMQDSLHREVVYAGTTEGLYKTVDGGRSFRALTSADVIVNDVHVDARDSKHLLLATDRGGVLSSFDGGLSFQASNTGFSERKVEALLVDRANPAELLAGVLNDKAEGGAFLSVNGGRNWRQIADGLEGRDVFELAEAPDGSILAGTNHGIFALDLSVLPGHWVARSTLETPGWKAPVNPVPRLGKGPRKRSPVQSPMATSFEMQGRVNALDLSGDAWLASTTSGLLTSRNKGMSWQGGAVMGSVNYLSVAAHGKLMAAARMDGLVLSRDGGWNWMPVAIPSMLRQIHKITFSSEGTLWLGAREGVYFTHDQGKTWMWLDRFPLADVDNVSYDTALGRVLVSSRSSEQFYVVDPKTLVWSFHTTGYRIAQVHSAGGHLVAASLFDGVLMEAQQADQAEEVPR